MRAIPPARMEPTMVVAAPSSLPSAGVSEELEPLVVSLEFSWLDSVGEELPDSVGESELVPVSVAEESVAVLAPVVLLPLSLLLGVPSPSW
jgi:hypothetical protein